MMSKEREGKYDYPLEIDQELEDFFVGLEGMSLMPYVDKYNTLTIGIGHNLKSNPLTEAQRKFFWPVEFEGDPIVTVKESLELMKKNGLTKFQVLILFADDITIVDGNLFRLISFYTKIHDAYRKLALLYMGFNIGANGTRGFRKFINALERKQYDIAADEIINSGWYKQVPRAAKAVEKMIRHNILPPLD